LLVLAVELAGAIEAVDPSEIAPGTAGVCITEMDGGERVEIPLTVLGTVGPWAPEGEMVLVRLEDERFRHTGIIAGMSGSPVYVDGRLLGALAFGWSFAKDPIGGVTPFVRMENLGDPPLGAAVASGRPAMVELLEANADGSLGELLAEWLLPAADPDRQALPLAVTGGAVPSATDWLGESWRRLGWVAVPGGSVDDTAGGELEPGAMVAGVMVDGDAVLAAGGTVTEVRGDEVWAFGHPFLGSGGTRLPMARARVVTVLPSQASSFKFFSVGETLGAFVSDRSRGIWGRLGESAPMVPVEVIVDGRDYDFRTVRHAGLTPFLVAYVVQASQAARGRLFGDQSIGLRIELGYAGSEPAVYRESIVSGEAPAQVSALAAAITGYLESSIFDPPELERISIELVTRERLETAVLIDAVVDRPIVAPGDELPVRVRFRPHRGPDFTREIRLQVPPNLPDGRLDLVVADGASWSTYELAMRPLRPGSFDDEIRLVNSLLPSTSLVLAFERRQPGVALDGGTVSAPPSLIAQLRSGLGPGLETTSYAVVDDRVEPFELPLIGAERIELLVRSGARESRPEVP
jgi:hypothetical protein